MAGPDDGGFDDDEAYEDTGGGVGGKAFLWLAWAAAAIFWGFMLTTGAGILRAADNPAIRAGGEDAGLGLVAMTAIGSLVLLALALAYGAWRLAGRDKSLDSATEAATAATYEMVVAAGGDDDIHRGPGARRPEERDAYRAINPRMN